MGLLGTNSKPRTKAENMAILNNIINDDNAQFLADLAESKKDKINSKLSSSTVRMMIKNYI